MWENLDDQQKIDYKKYCDEKYGNTICFCETGKPLYFNKEGLLIDTKIIIDLLFVNNLN